MTRVFSDSIGEFTELTNIIPTLTKPVDTFQTVFFKLRDNSYKKFEKYTDGLKIIVNETMSLFPEFYFTLFLDDSIKKNKKIFAKVNEIINTSKNKDRVIIIHYKFTQFRDETKKYHKELFGHLIRFCPWFNYENNPFKFAFCIDLDDGKNLRNKYTILIELHARYNCNLTYYNYFNHVVMNKPTYQERLRDRYKQKNPYFCPANIVAGDMKCPKELLEDFMKEVNEGQHTELLTHNAERRYKTFGYGIDEIFINDHLMKYMNEHKMLITPFVAYDCFDSTEILKRPTDKIKEVFSKNCEMEFPKLITIVSKLINFEDHTFDVYYITMFLMLKWWLDRKDYSVVPDYNLTTMTNYPNHILKHYSPIFAGDELLKEDVFLEVKFVDNKLIKINHLLKKVY